MEGLEFLTNVVTSGHSRADDASATLTPLSEQLVLAATLSVHPKFTSRANSLEEKLASDEALRFLKHVLSTVGPLNADFSRAFSCQRPRREPKRKRQSESQLSESDEEPNTLHSVFAHDKSLFAQVDDMWDIIGWAFNCSKTWKTRWGSWLLFLDFYLDLLDVDLSERLLLDAVEGSQASHEHIRESLAVKLLKTRDGRTSRRKFMRAIMADSSERSMKEFPEVFKNETRVKNDAKRDTKRAKLDIEQGKWGDYDMDEDEEAVADVSHMDYDSDEERDPFDLDDIRLRAKFFAMVCT